jgi:GT2 family glycosyltransferase
LLFSVVIPNLDGAHWLEACLASLRGGALAPKQVVVADDGSRDASAEVAARHSAEFLPAPAGRRGTGFAATTNRGIAACRGRWVVLLNNDTEVEAGALAALADAARRRPDVAMLAPLVRSLRDRRTIDSAGLLLYPDGVARPRWHGLPDAPGPLVEEEILLPSGAACAIRADWLARVGPLDESLGSYLEDVDWGLRALRAGARAFFVPRAVVYHHFSGTTGAFSAAKARHVERNRVIVAARHMPLTTLLASPAWTAVRWSVLARSGGAHEGRVDPAGSLARAAVGGAAAGLLALPRALGERRRLGRRAVVTPAAWSKRLRAHRARVGDLRRYGA